MAPSPAMMETHQDVLKWYFATAETVPPTRKLRMFGVIMLIGFAVMVGQESERQPDNRANDKGSAPACAEKQADTRNSSGHG
jgi:hypothetical protein